MPKTAVTQVSRGLLWLSTVTVILIATLLAKKLEYIFVFKRSKVTPGADAVTSGLDLPTERSFPTTYLRSTVSQSYSRPITPQSQRSPDVTAVILNWSRLPNVIRIVSELCGAQLEDTISEVVVWNNNPKKLSQNDFAYTFCPATKLRIVNSPENLYFQARFIACADASSPLCFIQDDDYLVYPEIIKALSARIVDPERASSTGIHLLPPHEHLSSSLRIINSQNPAKAIHTSFAWLGHGALIKRFHAREFLSLMGPTQLYASDDEMKMADNFYTILANEVAEIWFDHGIELSGGEAFTIGTEGLERNRRYIRRAGELLDSLLSADVLTLTNVSGDHDTCPQTARTACLNSLCILETTIRLLPQNMLHTVESATEMLTIEQDNFKILGPVKKSHYLKYPLSNAVDGRTDTAFCSTEGIHEGDLISLDMIYGVPRDQSSIEMAWLVDADTTLILQTAIFESSIDGVHWRTSPHTLACLDTSLSTSNNVPLLECSVHFSSMGYESGPRIFQAKLTENKHSLCIYELWVRSLSDQPSH